MANGLVDFRLIDPNMPAKVGTSWMQGVQQAEQDTAQQIQNQAAMQQYQNALAEAEAYKASGGDLNKLPQLLIDKGLPKQAMAVRKELREQRKSDIDSKVQGLKLIEHHGSNIYANPTMDNALNQVMTYAKSTGEDPTPLIAQLEATGGDPTKIKQFGFSYAMGAKDAIAAAQRGEEIGIKRGHLGVAQGQLELGRQRLAAEYDPTLIAQKAGATEIGKRQAIAQMDLPGALETANRGIKLIDEMIGDTKVEKGKLVYGKIGPHAGFGSYVGGTLIPGARFIEGSDTASFELRQKQIEGQAFLDAFQKLKGGGAITEKEGDKATAAISRMNKAASEVEYVAAARELQDILRGSIAKAKMKAGGGAKTTGGVVDFNDL